GGESEDSMRFLGSSFSALIVCGVCVACSGSSSSDSGSGSTQIAARDQAVIASCAKYAQCNQIGTGSGKLYKSDDDCRVGQQTVWQTAWPPKDCDGHIDGTQLNTC